ncbi:hypothetical protein RHSIM_Rhsim08G0112500 [Rhododendron simsii]|uniref:Uncharacterized protein n=1 Tax=Rhododendron simsii TaxID=118357 RepID=A0A834GLJ2_RHOSS|nr:hypothetical protein RHSIM_Rhsim08G0112500 [Rhododendron simsii]
MLLNNSVKAEPGLAVTLLRGLALPRDVNQVPTNLLPRLGKMCSHLVQKGKSWEHEAKNAEAEVEKLKKELVDAVTAVEIAKGAVRRMKDEEKEKLREADLKSFEAGIKRAALEYTQITHKMINDELEARLPDFYKLGYAAGANAMVGVMVIQHESGFLKQLLEPVVPNLELPYTEEECQPLPPEDDDVEMIKAEHQQGRVEEHVAEDGELKGIAEAPEKVTEDKHVQID